jgi:hypothetical protein
LNNELGYTSINLTVLSDTACSAGVSAGIRSAVTSPSHFLCDCAIRSPLFTVSPPLEAKHRGSFSKAFQASLTKRNKARLILVAKFANELGDDNSVGLCLAATSIGTTPSGPLASVSSMRCCHLCRINNVGKHNGTQPGSHFLGSGVRSIVHPHQLERRRVAEATPGVANAAEERARSTAMISDAISPCASRCTRAAVAASGHLTCLEFRGPYGALRQRSRPSLRACRGGP